ncbi:MAG: ComEC/Rec2 family competence protein, partial [Thermoleophilaceae bacterium]
MGAVAVGLGLAEASSEVVLAAGFAAFGVFAALRAPLIGALAAASVLAGAAGGELRLRAIDEPAGRIRDGEAVHLVAHLLTSPRPNAFGASAEVRVARGRLEGARLLLRAPRWEPLSRSLRVGHELRVAGRLEAIPKEAGGEEEGAAENGAFDFDAYLRGRGVAAELLLERASPTGRRRGGPAGTLDRMRERAERGVVSGMSAEEGALLRGMVLGQDEAISASAREDFRDSGLAHVLAVSGQNVVLLAALALPVLMIAGLGLRARLAALAALIAVYVPLAGAGPSLQRAGVMGLAGVVAMASSRPASRWYALLLAATATLAWNPRAWTDPGWQLSFAAVVGILVIGVPLGRVLRRAVEEVAPPTRLTPAVALLADGVAITVAATIATAPLLAHHFDSVALAGLPANLLALPAVAPAMWLGMLKIALVQAGSLGAPAAEALGAPAGLAVRYVGWLAERCADLPGGQLALPLGSTRAVLGAYAALGVAALALAR